MIASGFSEYVHGAQESDGAREPRPVGERFTSCPSDALAKMMHGCNQNGISFASMLDLAK
jgi:hypothetical protein